MIEIESYFSIQIFFIILRETLETAIIVSVLLSFINQRSTPSVASVATANSSASSNISYQHDRAQQQLQRKLKVQVWAGAVLGLVICVLIGLVFIVSFYFIGKDYWSYTERIWEGVFSILSSVIITVMGVGLLRINKVMKVKWWMKLGDAYNEEGDVADKLKQHNTQQHQQLPTSEMGADRGAAVTSDYGTSDRHRESESSIINQAECDNIGSLQATASRKTRFTKKYFLAILPFVTTLREGLEAVVFVGGIGMSQPLTSLPLSIFAGVALGTTIGIMLYKGGNKLSLQYFLILSTCFLYMVSAGLMSRGVWFLELEKYVRLCDGLDVSETGSGPGSYDIANSVWHVNCCNGLTDGWWMVFNAIFGWTNSATYGSVTSYIAYWMLVIGWLELRLYEERHGVLPLVPIKWQLKRIKKKVRLYEMRLHQQQEHQRLTDAQTTDHYQELRSNPSIDLSPREAEAQLLLAE